MSTNRIAYLLDCYGNQTATTSELKELAAILRQTERREEVTSLIVEQFFTATGMQVPASRMVRLQDEILQADKWHPAKSLSRKWVNRYRMAAAVLICLLGAATTVYLQLQKDITPLRPDMQAQRFKNDIPPGRFRARLTLAGGSTILLDSSLQGELARQGSTVVKNRNGQLVYSGGIAAGALVFNTLTTARGETYSTLLSDGTRVWLNSGSALTFPVSFGSRDRTVEVTGEAYFEVRHLPGIPFRVKTPGQLTEDIGTAFNIRAYPDEPVQATTLVEGSIRVSTGGRTPAIVLQPGQQSLLADRLSVNSHASLEEVLAWKTGLFVFESGDVAAIMKTLARWYDITVIDRSGGTSEKIYLQAGRNTSLQNVLKVLELTSGLRFAIDGKTVTVTAR